MTGFRKERDLEISRRIQREEGHVMTEAGIGVSLLSMTANTATTSTTTSITANVYYDDSAGLHCLLRCTLSYNPGRGGRFLRNKL